MDKNLNLLCSCCKKKDASHITNERVICSDCLKDFESYLYREHSWDYKYSNQYSNMISHSSLRPIVYNIESYNNLPESFKYLSNPLLALKYALSQHRGVSINKYVINSIESDLDTALIYNYESGYKSKTIEDHLISKFNKDLDNYKGEVYELIYSYIHNIFSFGGFSIDSFREGYNILIEIPEYIFKLSKLKEERIKEKEDLLCYDFEVANDYVGYHKIKKFEPLHKLVEYVKTSYYKNGKIDTQKIKDNYRFTTGSLAGKVISYLLNNPEENKKTSVHEFLEKEENLLKNRISKDSKTRLNFIKGKSLNDSLLFNSDFLFSYINNNYKRRFKNAEFLLNEEYNSIEYIIKYVKRRNEKVENKLFKYKDNFNKNSSLGEKYIEELSKSKYVTEFYNIEKIILNYYKERDESPLGSPISDDPYLDRIFSNLRLGYISVGKDFEEVCSLSPTLSYKYAVHLNSRFEKGEPAIFSEPSTREIYTLFLKEIKTKNN